MGRVETPPIESVDRALRLLQELGRHGSGVMLEELDARIADGVGHDLPVPFYSMPRGRFKRDML